MEQALEQQNCLDWGQVWALGSGSLGSGDTEEEMVQTEKYQFQDVMSCVDCQQF